MVQSAIHSPRSSDLLVWDASYINFDGVRLTRTGDDAMTSSIDITGPEGKIHVATTNYVSVKRFAQLSPAPAQ